MHSSTLFFLLTVFLVALTVSVSAYPEDMKEGEQKDGGEGAKKEGAPDEKKDTKEEKKTDGEGDKKNAAVSLFSSNGLSVVISLAIASLIFSIH